MRSSFVKLPFIDMVIDLLRDPLELMVDLGDAGLLYLRNEVDDE